MPSTKHNITVTVGSSAEDDTAAFLASCGGACVFHAAPWARVLRSSYGHGTDVHTARIGDSVVGAFIVVRQRAFPFGEKHVALPYQFFGGEPLTDDADVRIALIRSAAARARAARAKYLEIRTKKSYPEFAAEGFCEIDSQLVVTDLHLPDYDLSKIRRGILREVKYAAEAGLEIRHLEPKVGMPIFRDLYRREMRGFGAPQAGPSFFAALLREMPEQIFISTAVLGGETIGAIFVIGDENAVFGRGIAGATTARGREYFVGKALTYAAIEAAKNRGQKIFHMGITWVGDGGLSAYKGGWQGETQAVRLYVLPIRGEAPAPGGYFEGFRLAKAVWKRMPLFFCDWMGHQVTRWIG